MLLNALSRSVTRLPGRLFSDQTSSKLDVSIKQYVAAFGGPQFNASRESISVERTDLIAALNHAKLFDVDNRTSSNQALALNRLAVKAGICEDGTFVNSLLGPRRIVVLASK